MGQIVAAMASVHAPQLFTRPPEEDPRQLDAGIAAIRRLGKVLDETKPDALVIFASDNGPHKEGGHDPEFFHSGGPLRGIKRDLYEGGNAAAMLGRAASLVASGVNLIVLLALSDDGRPSYDANNAGKLAALGCPIFACTPDLFPDLMAAALRRDDLADWAAARDIALVRASG